VTLARQTEKVLRVAEVLFRQPLGSAFPLPGELADWDLHARLERVLSRALQGGAAPAEAASSSEPLPEGRSTPGAPRTDLWSTASPFARARPAAPAAEGPRAPDAPRFDFGGTANPYSRGRPSEPVVASAGLYEASMLQVPEPAGMAAHVTHLGASPGSSGEGNGSPRGSPALQGSSESGVRARAPAPFTNFPERGTVAASLGFPSVPMYRPPAPTMDALAEKSRPLTRAPVVPAERAVFEQGPAPVRDGAASGSRSVRMVSTPAELAALLRSHVDAPEALPSRPPVRDTAPAAPVFAGPGPARASPAAPMVHVPEPVSLPEVSFTGSARETGAGGAAEELLLDKLLDRFQDRLREESIRRFGLTGGDL
jgi:hypothetical protein